VSLPLDRDSPLKARPILVSELVRLQKIQHITCEANYSDLKLCELLFLCLYLKDYLIVICGYPVVRIHNWHFED